MLVRLAGWARAATSPSPTRRQSARRRRAAARRSAALRVARRAVCVGDPRRSRRSRRAALAAGGGGARLLNGSAALAYLWLGVNITTTVQLGTPVHVSGGDRARTAVSGGASCSRCAAATHPSRWSTSRATASATPPVTLTIDAQRPLPLALGWTQVDAAAVAGGAAGGGASGGGVGWTALLMAAAGATFFFTASGMRPAAIAAAAAAAAVFGGCSRSRRSRGCSRAGSAAAG